MNKNIEQQIAELREKYQELTPEKQAELKKSLKKLSFLDYKKVEMIKSELVRLEARRAQLELCEKQKECEHLEEKIKLKKEKLLRCLGKQLYKT